MKFGTSGRWVGTRTGAGVTATLVEESFFGHSPWIHGHQTVGEEEDVQESGKNQMADFTRHQILENFDHV